MTYQYSVTWGSSESAIFSDDLSVSTCDGEGNETENLWGDLGSFT